MVLFLWILFFCSTFIVFYAMVGYPFVLILMDKVKRYKKNEKNTEYEPTVTYMIVAHNEEKVILSKLENALTLDYPKDKFEVLVASDNSTDGTNEIVRTFIKEHPNRRIRLYCSIEHKGKTNAQNEAQKTTDCEILVMTDANTILKKNSIKELVSSFVNDDISYVCGKLTYSNSEESLTSDSENTYWNLELKLRDIESRIKTITAGNGAIYACRNNRYVDFPAMRCHDGAMPYYYAIHGQRAIFNPDAVAFEKAGENDQDEFKRKVRMNRNLSSAMGCSLAVLNVFKYGWFAFFYFGHRTCRQSLWLVHLVAFIVSIILTVMGKRLALIAFILQLLVVLLVMVHMKKGFKNKLFRMIGYYGMTVYAQYVALYRAVKGQSKATWEKAESTR